MKSQKFIFWLRWAIFLSILSNAFSNLASGPSRHLPPLWPPLVMVGGWTLFYVGRLMVPVVKQHSLLYKLYRYRSPARVSGQLERPPLSPGLLERWYLHIRPPKWCRKSDDALMIIYRDRKKLLREGTVALAVLVQANVTLFKKGTTNAPAAVLYMTEWEVDGPVLWLMKVADKIFSLKDTKPDDPDERKFAKIISYELAREFRVSVPASLSGGLDATYTTIMIHRKHLPYGYLTGSYVPLLIHQESRAAMILPARYWPDEIVSDWSPEPPAKLEAGEKS